MLTVDAVATRRLTRAEAMRHSGLTYRRLDYWCRREVLGELTPTARGSGTQRVWTADAVHALTVCRRVADCVTPDVGTDPLVVPSPSFPLDTLRHVVRELIDRRFPVAGYLLTCGDLAVWCPDLTAAAVVIEAGGAWIATALDPSDRPE